MMEVRVDRNDLRKLSGDFRGYASRLLRTDFNDADSNLRRLIKFIDESEIISGFIEQRMGLAELDSTNFEQPDFDHTWDIPDDPDQEIAWVYSLLKATAKGENELSYFNISSNYDHLSGKIQSRVTAFNKRVVQPFVDHINRFLEGLMIDAGFHDNKATFHITNSGTYIAGNAQGSVIASGGSTILDSTATYTDGASLAQGISKLRSFLDEVPAGQRDEAEEAIDVLIASASGAKIPKSQLARRVEFLGGLDERMKRHLTDLAVNAGGSLVASGVITAIGYVYDLIPK